MIKLLKNANVYAPEPMGEKDILVVGEKICSIEEDLGIYENLPDVEVFDLEGKYVIPGYIDMHVHITGGGGEKGPVSRVPESQLSSFLINGGSRTSWNRWSYEKCGKSRDKSKGSYRRRNYSLCTDQLLWISSRNCYRKCGEGYYDDSADYRGQGISF